MILILNYLKLFLSSLKNKVIVNNFIKYLLIFIFITILIFTYIFYIEKTKVFCLSNIPVSNNNEILFILNKFQSIKASIITISEDFINLIKTIVLMKFYLLFLN